MLNRPISFVIGVNQIDGENEYEIIHHGASYKDARRVYTENRMNEDFDLVGFQTMPGFQSKSYPKRAAEERQRQENQKKQRRQ